MSATIFEKNGTVLTVKPEGRLDSATSPVLGREVRQHLDGIQELVMDFANVEYSSSGGMRMLLEIEALMEERHGSMRIIHANRYILEVFDLVGFMDVVTVEQDGILP